MQAQQELVKHYGSITAENDMKPMFMLDEATTLSDPAKYDKAAALKFDTARPYLDFAKEHGIGLRGHVLIWHGQTSIWFFKKDYQNDWNAPNLDRETMLVRMENYIKGVLEFMQTEYPGVIYAWDVVNEAVEETHTDGWRDSLWLKTIGKDFVVQAFRFARKYADKDVKLFYNDYNAFWPEKMKYIIQNILEPLCKEGIVDGMGMQTHLVRDESNLEDYEKAGFKDCESYSTFDEMLEKAHSLGIRIIMDLVVNHSSDEHKWFVESKSSKDNSPLSTGTAPTGIPALTFINSS